MGKTKSRKRRVSKKASTSKNFFHSPVFWILLVVLIAIGSYFVFRAIRYYSAPEAIKAIRSLPIYNYESDTLEIVDRREDYGGTDWKDVYIEPRTTLYFQIMEADGDLSCTSLVSNYLKSTDWVKRSTYKLLDGSQGTRFVTERANLALEPQSKTEQSSCTARITVTD